MWDTRYDTPEYLFGTRASVFLTAHAGLVPAGARTLCVAEGEGRNAVWLASQGCAVTGFDASSVGLEKARALAQRAKVDLTLHHASVEDWDWSRTYGLVVAIFIQFAPPALRARIFDGLRQAVAPGGRLLLHGYTPQQVVYGTGGPRDPDHLYTEDMLRDAFGDWQILRLAAYEADLDEGHGHAGRSALIDLIADKPH